MTPREHFEMTHDAARAHPANIPDLPAEPKPLVLFTCPLCGLEQSVQLCPKCQDPLCERCDPDPEMHVRCLPPERMTPYLLLQDCQLTLLRVNKALREGKREQAHNIADNMERVLRGKAIR